MLVRLGTSLSRAMRSSVQGPVAELCRGFGVPANASILTESESRMGRVFRPDLLSLALWRHTGVVLGGGLSGYGALLPSRSVCR